MITANVIHRTFYIKFGGSSGTGFTIDLDGRQYFVTAKHVVDGLHGSGQLGLFSQGGWSPVQVDLVGHSTEADISVVAVDRRLTPSSLPLDPTIADLTYGQDLFFLGFPYGLQGNIQFTAEGYPLPFVKKAVLSNWVLGENVSHILYLDGHNNPGFSGGPVVFSNPNTNDTTFRVAGVVSGYMQMPEPVYQGEAKTPLDYLANTGIIVAHGIKGAVDLIHTNPVGFPLP